MIGPELFTLLSGQTDLGTKVYPSVAPDNAQAPFAIYQRVGANPEVALSGPTNLTNTRLQVDVYSKTYVQAQEIAVEVQAVIVGWPGKQVVPLTQQDSYDQDAKLHRVILEYSIWH